MLDLKNQYFIAVMEEGSFSAAAKKCYVSQPALSKQIQLLEGELNIQLLDRSYYRPKATEAGLVYYQKLKQILKEYEDMLEEIAHLDKKKIQIAFTGIVENSRAVQALRALQNEITSLKLSFVKCDFQDSLEKLLHHEVDLSFGIETTFFAQENVCFEVLFPQEICVICSFDHPFSHLSSMTVDQIKKENIIILSQKFGEKFYKRFFESCRLDQFKPHVVKEVDSFDELVFEVSIGNGIAIVSKDVVRSSDVHMIDLKDSHHESDYGVAYLRDADDGIIQLVHEIKHYFETL